MADQEKARQEKEQQDKNLKMREALNNGYAALEGEKYTSSVLAFTFEEAVSQQIDRLEGAGSVIRPSAAERVDTVEAELLAAVEQIKQIPPEAFLIRNKARDVNSDEQKDTTSA